MSPPPKVAAALTAFPGIADANVYGVAVPGPDGKCGMAALEPVENVSIFPASAPIWLCAPARLCPAVVPAPWAALAVTETFKQKKQELAAEGFDPAASQIRFMPIWARAMCRWMQRFMPGSVRA